MMENFKITVDPYRCPQNHRCPVMGICPVGAISQDGYGLPTIDQEKCIHCGKCLVMCPTRALVENA